MGSPVVLNQRSEIGKFGSHTGLYCCAKEKRRVNRRSCQIFFEKSQIFGKFFEDFSFDFSENSLRNLKSKN